MAKYRFVQHGPYYICFSWPEHPRSNRPPPTYYVFNRSGLGLLHTNYRAGKCPVTDRGLRRYSFALVESAENEVYLFERMGGLRDRWVRNAIIAIAYNQLRARAVR